MRLLAYAVALCVGTKPATILAFAPVLPLHRGRALVKNVRVLDRPLVTTRVTLAAKGVRRGKGGFIDVGDKERLKSLTVTDFLLVINVAFFIAQVASAFTAHAHLNNAIIKMGGRGISAMEAGLPFSIPSRVMRLGGGVLSSQGTFTRDFILNPLLIGRPFKQSYRALTSAFLHGSGIHLGLNMWNLNRVGRMTERLFGPWLFSFAYLTSALAGAGGHLVVNSRNPALGASGAVMGLYGFLWAHYQRRGDKIMSQQLLRYMVSVLIFGLLSPGVGNVAHVGGFLGGAATNWLSGPSPALKPKTTLYRETRKVVVNGEPFVKPALLALALLLVAPGVREVLWQTPAAAHIYALHPGLLSRGVSPAAAVPQAVKPFLLAISRR
mmetsp:Transcript_27046/g.55348  ORF Transcript_27046/g.55348 Transcript_27046/m.55348 type:complete len:381 (+) Transcript_27046:42-1184(+)